MVLFHQRLEVVLTFFQVEGLERGYELTRWLLLDHGIRGIFMVGSHEDFALEGLLE